MQLRTMIFTEFCPTFLGLAAGASEIAAGGLTA